ncbi:sugar ABC transporter [Sorangium cellulosum]|uniref:Sugar ABC transporter n=1 Tax=Sorangium cellulosum TaxID=56 RepID=A0A4P2PYR3_SORCE|nr:substrate-binding domain-containing protein [Sorangium cellulosum]AUX21930.1 sugar ABC transporter [Sorangium cellulosum]
MSTGLDISATLHRTVQDALNSLPGAQRGALLIREGERLILRAAVGFEGALPYRLRIPADAGPASGLSLLGPANRARVAPADAWYRAHLPGATAPDRLPAGAAMVLAPVRMHGEPIGVLALEQPAEEAPAAERWARLLSLADSAAAVLERRALYDDKARSAHESRLLEEVLNAVAARASPHDLVEIVSYGIKSVQLEPQWTAVTLVLLEDAGRGAPAAAGDGRPREVRVYRVPRRAPTAYWNNLRDGALAAGRNLGVFVDHRLGGVDGPAGQSALVDEGVRRGVHGIAVAPMDPAGIEPALRRAAEAGIPVVTLDAPPIEGSSALAYIGTDNVAAGRLAGEMMARLLPGGGKVGTQAASFRAENGPARIRGFGAALAGTAVAPQPPSENRYDTALGVRLAVEALRQGELAGAFGACAENGPAWGEAARAAGRAGDLKIVAFDLVAETIAMLREGTIHAAVVQREYEMGYCAVQLLHDMATRGVEAALAGLPAPAQPGERRSPRILDTGVDLVTLERTPWSRALADHLALDTGRKAASRRRGLAGARRPVELLVIAVDVEEEGFVEESTAVDAESLVGRVLSSGRPAIVDTHAPASELQGMSDVVEARGRGTRTRAVVPLHGREAALGVLVLDSERRDACSPEDLTFIERVADIMAVALENVQLLQRITQRTLELEQANRQQESLLSTIHELSTPVVPIARNILVMPIVGAMDTQRSGRFIESLLQEITERRASVVLIDVTGMAAVDAAAASHLLAAARAARLLGAEVVLAGITPAAARLLVEQGMDLGGLVTHSTLELGFVHALSRTGGKVIYSRNSGRPPA